MSNRNPMMGPDLACRDAPETVWDWPPPPAQPSLADLPPPVHAQEVASIWGLIVFGRSRRPPAPWPAHSVALTTGPALQAAGTVMAPAANRGMGERYMIWPAGSTCSVPMSVFACPWLLWLGWNRWLGASFSLDHVPPPVPLPVASASTATTG